MLSLIVYTIGTIIGLGVILYVSNKVADTKEFKKIIEHI
jgi:hypothetical protein